MRQIREQSYRFDSARPFKLGHRHGRADSGVWPRPGGLPLSFLGTCQPMGVGSEGALVAPWRASRSASAGQLQGIVKYSDVQALYQGRTSVAP